MGTLDKRILATTTEMTDLAENEIKTLTQQMNNKLMDCERQGESARLSRTSTRWGTGSPAKSRGSTSMADQQMVDLNRADTQGLDSPTKVEAEEQAKAQEEEST